ncbi:EAL domain-containing protein [Labrenzia sp. OB1]|uniref:putative bifunctional diguanylate cyclase/phosphodiesterase n=1 Tax=Labrenzia sp. OB1 TaxID=1561204 RepID=UPI001AD8E5DD|nr:EAL domain-containing protein [Labrenzia sp. OB1]
MGNLDTDDGQGLRGQGHLLRGAGARLDKILVRWCCGEDIQFEKPLRTIFLSIFALTVSLLTIQNISAAYWSMNEPQKQLVRTVERLLIRQKALGTETLDQIVSTIGADSALQTAIREKNSSEIRKIAAGVFARKPDGLHIAEFTIYGADQKRIFRALEPNPFGDRHGPHPASHRISFQSDLIANLSRQTSGIELGPDAEPVVSVFRSWTANGKLIGYLKLAIDIESALAITSSAVDAQIVKIAQTGESHGLNGHSFHYTNIGGPVPGGLDIAAISGSRGFDGLNKILFHENRIFVLRDLPIPVTGTQRPVYLALVKDVTRNVWAFAQETLLSLMAGIGLALVSWTVIHRLLSRLQSSVQTTTSRLEAEVRENTRKLEHSAFQLTEAQRIAGVGSWERNIATNEVLGSEEFYRILNIPKDLPTGEIQETIYSRVPEPEFLSMQAIVNRAEAICGEFDFKHSLVWKDGDSRFLHVRGYALAGPDGKAAKVIGTVHDITERRLAERRNNLLANILESSLNEIFILNPQTFLIEYANKCALNNLGYDLADLKCRHIWDINPVYDAESVRKDVTPLLNGSRQSLTVESLHKRKDGSEYPVDLRVQLLKDDDRDLFIAIANDVSERVQRENETREAKVRAERLAYFDPLTKLSNRAGCQRDAKAHFSRSDKPAFLVHVDMDGFKRVNDTLGHLAGDHCLEETGRRLRQVCRGLGTAYRWGGDEFVILAKSSTSDPNELCERARRLMRAPMEFSGTRFWPTVSMGIALCPEDGDDFDTLLVNADLALYQSKEKGKDRYTFFRSDMKTDSEIEAKIELELHDAVKNDQFMLVFQPQVNLRSQSITGVEALVRWEHPERGLLSPAEFLPVVEKTSLAPLLGKIVIDTALAAAKHWMDARLDFGRVSINISPSHLASGLLVEHFKEAMAKYEIGPERITAEVLESVFLSDDRSGQLAALEELYDLGVHIELDDFGTGYASLTHVADLPINGLKIDKSFTNQMLQDSKKEAVVNQLIQLARSLNIGIVCEGVETEAQYDRLRMMGDFSVQGYLVARPMTFDRMTDWMTESADDLYYVI